MRFFLPLFLWFIVCTVLFTLPGSAFPKTTWLSKIWFDKWVHIGIISSLVFLAGWGLYRYQNRKLNLSSLIWIGAAASVYGVIIEFVQLYFVANRSFDGGDVIADVVGAIAGCWFCWWRYIKK